MGQNTTHVPTVSDGQSTLISSFIRLVCWFWSNIFVEIQDQLIQPFHNRFIKWTQLQITDTRKVIWFNFHWLLYYHSNLRYIIYCDMDTLIYYKISQIRNITLLVISLFKSRIDILLKRKDVDNLSYYYVEGYGLTFM